MSKLTEARNKLRGGALADQIDRVLHSDGYGKEIIRRHIRSILANHETKDTTHEARILCNQIAALNAELDRLQRMVYD